MFQNGLIRRYLICITEAETWNTFNYTTSLTSYLFHSLHPYYNYEIKVAAVTIASGPFSMTLTIQTLSDGMPLDNLMYYHVDYYYQPLYELQFPVLSLFF